MEILEEGISIYFTQVYTGLIEEHIISTLITTLIFSTGLYFVGAKEKNIIFMALLFVVFQITQQFIHGILGLDALKPFGPGNPWNDFMQHLLNLSIQAGILYLVINLFNPNINNTEVEI